MSKYYKLFRQFDHIGINSFMISFQQFIEQKKQANGFFGMGTGKSPTRLMAMGSPKPAKPGKLTYKKISIEKI